MKLDKLFGSKTKADILKYLVFRRQGISVRAFESELTWSFPAIKKQIDSLEEAGVVTVKKTSSKRSIYLTE
jgi:predicted ArsR family transcriptional regulator